MSTFDSHMEEVDEQFENNSRQVGQEIDTMQAADDHDQVIFYNEDNEDEWYQIDNDAVLDLDDIQA